MTQQSSIFQKNYETYRSRIGTVDFATVAPMLGLVPAGDRFRLEFLGRAYFVSPDGIEEESGKTPDYMIRVILAKYLILCPDHVYQNGAWCAFRDFKKESHFLNVNYFTSDTENVITGTFAGKIDTLARTCAQLGGERENDSFAYDLVVRFRALPRISLLLLFNERDDDFTAYSTVLFQKQAERYLDPESLAMTSAYLAYRLKALRSGSHIGMSDR
jgi:hypothetical protein